MKGITFTTRRRSVAMPLILGLATIAAAPTVGAVTIESVDIINGFVDVTQSGFISGLDDATDVALWCNDAAPIRVDIIDGVIDVDEDGDAISDFGDDLTACDLTDETDGPLGDNNGVPQRNQVDICDGLVEVNEAPCPADSNDDATDIQLFDLP